MPRFGVDDFYWWRAWGQALLLSYFIRQKTKPAHLLLCARLITTAGAGDVVGQLLPFLVGPHQVAVSCPE